MEMARGVGTPLQLDPMTKEGKFDFYARILVDVDLSKPLPEYIMIEREGYGFPVDVVYEKLPPLCDFCGLIGHNSSACRQNNKKKDSEPAKPKVKQISRVKAPISEIPESTQEPGNHTNTNPLTENLQIIDRVVDPDTHANNSVDPAKEISLNPEISHDDNTMLSNPTELDALESETFLETKSMGSNPLTTSLPISKETNTQSGHSDCDAFIPAGDKSPPSTPTVDFGESSKESSKMNSDSPASEPPGFDKRVHNEVATDSPLSAPPGFEQQKSWADDCEEEDNPTTPKSSPEFHHEIDMVLQVTSASTDQNPEEFQEVLSKSQKKKKKKALQSQRTEPYLTRGRKIVIPR